jgi:hypothetical protein
MRKAWIWALSLLTVSLAFAAPTYWYKTRFAETRGYVYRGHVPSKPVNRLSRPMTRAAVATRVGSSGSPILLNGSLPVVTPVAVQLSGEVIEAGSSTEPLTVSIVVGTQRIAAAVTGNAFVANLGYVPRKTIISVETAKGDVVYRSLLGSADLVKRQAGADNTLSADENPSLRLSPLSTAIHFFLSRELGGRLPVSDDEMDRALRAMYFTDLAPAANALSKIASGSIALPFGFTSGYALLQDEQAYRQFIASNRSNPAFGSADAYVQSVPSQTFAQADLDRDWVLTGRMLFNGVSFVQPSVQLLLANANGYAVHSSPSRRNTAFTRQVIADGALEMLPEGTVSYELTGVRNVPVIGPVVTAERRNVLRETHRRFFMGKRDQLWLSVRQEQSLLPQYPEVASTSPTTVNFQIAADFAKIKVPGQDSDLLGRRAAPVFCVQPSRATNEPKVMVNCEYALHFFGTDGSAVAENLGPKVDSLLNPVGASGAVALRWYRETDGGWRVEAPGYTLRLWRLGISDGGGDAMLYFATAMDGTTPLTMAGHTVMINGNFPVGLLNADIPGAWKYATFGDERVPYAYDENFPLSLTTFIRDADGTQIQRTFFDAVTETFTQDNRSGWKLIGIDLYDTRYRANVSTGIPNVTNFANCESAFARGATQCAPTRVRYFKPLSRVGNRWYGIEDLYTRFTTTSYTPPFDFERNSRGNFYEKQ